MSETILRVAARGDGVTENGRHVPFAAPGDVWEGDSLIAAGPHRAVPPCRHFPECGGCQLQHIDDAAFGDFLRDRIASALAAQEVATPDILPPHISPPNSRRRASLRAESRGKQVLLGFSAEKSHRVIDMRECHILRPELFALVGPLRSLLGRLLGSRGSAGIRMTLADQGIDVLLEGVSADGLEVSEVVSAFAARHKLARLALDDGYGPQTRWEPEPVTVTLGGRDGAGVKPPLPGGERAFRVPVALPHGAFLQATAEGEAALVASVHETVGDASAVADLFAGLGTFALASPGRVYAAEGARDAALALKAAAHRAQRQLFVDHRDLFRRPLTAAEADRFDAVILDPPRAGAKEQVAELARAAVPRIAYVSCNPSTFARDAKILIEGGYRLEWVRPVGQFRWSVHVELSASFHRSPA